MRKYIWENIEHFSKSTGGGKARRDVVYFLSKENFEVVKFYNSNNIFRKIIYLLLNIFTFPLMIKANSVLFVQYPLNIGQRIILSLYKKFLKIECIFLIHDLESLRFNYNIKQERYDLELADKIISLNQEMTDYIIEYIGVNKIEFISNLNLWGYRIPINGITQEFDLTEKKEGKTKVLIAGNLDNRKAKYLKDLNKIKGVHFYLIGANFDKSVEGDNITYLGNFDSTQPIRIETNPEEIVYGLVWDGDSIETCNGFYGEYLAYNLPHKTSFYLANQLPVCVWSRAAIYPFIKDLNVGIGIDNLQQIPYLSFKHNTNISRDIAIQLSEGYFLKSSITRLGLK